MKRVSFLATALLILGACGNGETESEAPATVVTYFENGRVILGDGSDPIENAAIIVDDGIITGIGPASEVQHPAGADRYNLSNHTVLPFLHNMHGHVGYVVGSDFSKENYNRENIIGDLDRFLYYGVYSVAVLGSDAGDEVFQIREEQRNGTLNSARVFTSGRGITGPGSWPTMLDGLEGVPYEVANEAQAREAVTELASKDVDFIKLWVDDNRRVTGQIFRAGRLTDQISTVPKMRPDAYRAVIDEARQQNIPVVAHVKYLADAKSLVDAGVSGIVHSIRDRDVDAALIEAMRENDVFYVPTLTAHQASFIYADEPAWLGERSMRESVSGAVIARLSSPGIVGAMKQDPNVPYLRREYEVALRNAKALFDAGIRVAVGTDAATPNRFPGYFEHRELELLVEAGLTPLQALTAGTSVPAQILGIEDETGALGVGKLGNFFIVPGKPLEDITATRDIAEVFKDGQRMERSTMMTRFTR